MAIKFVCSCGKRLRARDEMAARRAMCPRCGAPVGVPALRPTHPGTAAAPMTPAERLRARRLPLAGILAQQDLSAVPERTPDVPPHAGSRDVFHRPLDTGLVRLVVEPKRRSRQLETRWYEAFLYPLRAWPLVLGLTAVLTVLAGCTALALPNLFALQQGPRAWLFGLLYLPAPVLVLSYAFALLEGALVSGLAGDSRHIRWPGRSLALALRSGAIGLSCFLAGPVFLVGGSFLYWLQCGDPTAVDWLILVELNVLAWAYGLFALVAVCQSDRLLDVNPLRVADVVHRLGYDVRLLILLSSVLALAHGLLAAIALWELNRRPQIGWTLLAGSCLSGLFLGPFLLRLLGVWCHRARYSSRGR